MPSVSRPKKVVLIRNANSFDFGGAEIFPTNLAQELVHNGFSVTILSANKKTLASAKNAGIGTGTMPWWSFQNFSGFRLLLFPIYMLWQLYLVAWLVVWSIKHRVDVLHPQSRDDFIAATFAAKILRKQVVWTDHADLKNIYMNHGKMYKNPVGKLVYLAGILADHITIESYSEKKLIEFSLGKQLPKNYTVVHIGIVDGYKPVSREHKSLVFTSTSRLVKSKGIGELIEAFKLMDRADVVLRLCGDGPEASHFKSLASGIKNIEFLGHVNDVTQVLQNSDVFVHPTYHEGFGLSLVEAEMCCLPIIASDVGSVPEIVKDKVNGMLVRPKNIDDLVEAINTLAKSSDLRAKMGRAGRQIYLDNFQLDKIVKEKFLPLYEQR